jgi:predicted enzyme related to lactoylglutathione lyase
MVNLHGRFVWYELMTTDVEGAKTFYGKIMGWSTQDASVPGTTYAMFKAGENGVGGLMTLPEEACKMGAPPNWMGYVGVDDVDASAARVKQLGGKLYVAPTDIPGIGRFAVAADPQGASFALFKPGPDQPSPPSGAPMVEHVGWHELLAVDWQKALAFYADLFGWQKADAVDMGPMGTYQLFSTGGKPTGGMFNKPAAVPVAFWLYYFNVSDINAATERVKAAGGQIANGPMQVPGGSWIVQCRDPQGAMFALLAPQS